MIIPFQVLDFMSKIEQWDAKIKKMLSGTDNVLVGGLIFGGILVVSFWAIKEFNKK